MIENVQGYINMYILQLFIKQRNDSCMEGKRDQ